MYIRSLLKRGDNHHDFCEDANFYYTSKNITYLAVFDGCSTGKKSYFASELLSKLLQKSIKTFETNRKTDLFMNKLNKQDNSLDILKKIFVLLFKDLQSTKNILDISVDELLSTMILAVIKNNINENDLYEGKMTTSLANPYNYNITIAFAGDGAYYYQNNIKIIESENNSPDYLAYHLNDSVVDVWKTLKIFNIVASASDINNFSIMSDGITSFKKQKNNINDYVNDEEFNEVIKYLLEDNKLYKSAAMLPRKLNILKNKGYNHYDDLSILKIIDL